MKRLMTMAVVAAFAAGAAACANSPMSPDAAFSSSDGGVMTTAAKGGGGGKPGGGGTTGGGTGTISLRMVMDKNGDGLPSFNDVVTFNVSTTSTAYPWVTLKCYQNGTLVLQTSNGIFPTSINQNFTLGPSGAWQSGAANCTATLENWDAYPKSITTLGSTSFSVN